MRTPSDRRESRSPPAWLSGLASEVVADDAEYNLALLAADIRAEAMASGRERRAAREAALARLQETTDARQSRRRVGAAEASASCAPRHT